MFFYRLQAKLSRAACLLNGVLKKQAIRFFCLTIRLKSNIFKFQECGNPPYTHRTLDTNYDDYHRIENRDSSTRYSLPGNGLASEGHYLGTYLIERLTILLCEGGSSGCSLQ